MVKHQNIMHIAICGDKAVGKSSLVSQFKGNLFLKNHPKTLLVDFNILDAFIDSAGQQTTRKLHTTEISGSNPPYGSNIFTDTIKKAAVVLLVYDVTNQASFSGLEERRQSILMKNSEVKIIIVGTKSDLTSERVIHFKTAEDYAVEHGCYYLETSAKNGENVKKLFNDSARACF